jgi:AraC-like DNA-binding protein
VTQVSDSNRLWDFLQSEADEPVSEYVSQGSAVVVSDTNGFLSKSLIAKLQSKLPLQRVEWGTPDATLCAFVGYSPLKQGQMAPFVKELPASATCGYMVGNSEAVSIRYLYTQALRACLEAKFLKKCQLLGAQEIQMDPARFSQYSVAQVEWNSICSIGIHDLLLSVATFERYASSNQNIQNQPNRYVRDILTRVQMSSNTMSTLGEVAKSIGLNPAYAGRIFQKYMHMTYIEYVNKTRVNKALLRLLLYPEEPMNTIAAEAGFQDPRHFYRTFKDVCGITPKEFREWIVNSR